MKGHEALIQLRAAGRVPKYVFINDYPCSTDWFQWGEQATVCVAGDPLSSIDFRFLNGVTAIITGSTEKRTQILFNKAKQYAKTVAACHNKGKEIGWTEVHHG